MYQKILFAADFDEVGLYAAQKAKEIAIKYQAELYLAHVVAPIPAYAYPGFSGFAEMEVVLQEQADQELSKLGDSLEVPVARRSLLTGLIKNEILSLADKLSADLIVTGSHGRHGLALLLASTASAILHGAHCDVLIVRGPETQ